MKGGGVKGGVGPGGVNRPTGHKARRGLLNWGLHEFSSIIFVKIYLIHLQFHNCEENLIIEGKTLFIYILCIKIG